MPSLICSPQLGAFGENADRIFCGAKLRAPSEGKRCKKETFNSNNHHCRYNPFRQRKLPEDVRETGSSAFAELRLSGVVRKYARDVVRKYARALVRPPGRTEPVPFDRGYVKR